MAALGKKLRSAEGGGIHFWCPGCNAAHRIQVGDGPGPRWNWNGDAENPTFTPSVLVRSGHYASHHNPEDLEGCWCSYSRDHPDEEQAYTCGICHSFVTEGRIQFLGDCTHALANQTVDLPDFEK